MKFGKEMDCILKASIIDDLKVYNQTECDPLMILFFKFYIS